ncbi:MAG: glycosyltransferase [Alphaproteobacteria bacterium]
MRAYLAGLFADKIDVLSSDIFNNLKKSFMLKQKCSQTPNGSFVFANDYKALSKKPYVVFLSRLTEGKGLTDFLNILPKLWEEIKIKAPKNIEFIIAGKGNLFDFAQKQTLLLKENGIPISMAGEVHTPSFLQNVSVFLSLQEVTNYPSRVIAESLFSGTQVIIRNTGDSKKIGNLTGIDYCSATLNDKELSEKILISIKKALNEEHIKQTILEAKNIFSSKKTIDYFESLIS